MNRNILFLDDSISRQRAFRANYPDATIVSTAAQANSALAQGAKWDAVFLDHDLGDEVYVDSQRTDCGMEVVRWIVENRPQIDQIIVHSFNAPAAEMMVEALGDAGYKAWRRPFWFTV